MKYLISVFGGRTVGELTLADGFDPSILHRALARKLKATPINEAPEVKPAAHAPEPKKKH